jgi:hypothetical protein
MKRRQEKGTKVESDSSESQMVERRSRRRNCEEGEARMRQQPRHTSLTGLLSAPHQSGGVHQLNHHRKVAITNFCQICLKKITIKKSDVIHPQSSRAHSLALR